EQAHLPVPEKVSATKKSVRRPLQREQRHAGGAGGAARRRVGDCTHPEGKCLAAVRNRPRGDAAAKVSVNIFFRFQVRYGTVAGLVSQFIETTLRREAGRQAAPCRSIGMPVCRLRSRPW